MEEEWWNKNWYRLLECNIACIILASPVVFVSYYLHPILFFILLNIFAIIISCTIVCFIIYREATAIKKLHDKLDTINRVIELKEKGIIP